MTSSITVIFQMALPKQLPSPFTIFAVRNIISCPVYADTLHICYFLQSQKGADNKKEIAIHVSADIATAVRGKTHTISSSRLQSPKLLGTFPSSSEQMTGKSQILIKSLREFFLNHLHCGPFSRVQISVVLCMQCDSNTSLLYLCNQYSVTGVM